MDPFSIRHRKTAMTCKEFSKRVTQLENAIALTGRPELEDNNCVIQTFILLSSYKVMKEYQDSAIIALFLRNILLNSFRRDRLMDMLIRLYLANQLDGLLIRSSNLIDGKYQTNSTDQTNNNILAHYLTISSDSEADKITQQKLGCFIDNENGTTKKLNVTIPSGLDKMDFSDLYKMINDNFTISESDLYELFETYFNENRLLVFCNLYNDVLQHADDVIADIESIAQTTERRPSFALERLSINPEVWKSYFKTLRRHRTIDAKQRFSGNRKQRQRKAMWITSIPTLNQKFV